MPYFFWAECGHSLVKTLADRRPEQCGFCESAAASNIEANPCKDGHALAMTPEGDDWCLREGCTFRTGADKEGT